MPVADRADRRLQPRGDPAVLDVRGARPGLDVVARLHQDQPRGVPDLVGQVAALLRPGPRSSGRPGWRTSPAARSAARRRRARRSRRAGRCRCRGSSTSVGRRAPGSPGGRRRRVNGTCSVNSSEVMIIRATQRKMMSRAVVRTSVGKKALSSGVSSGHPSVANGHRAELNQVSRTSSSCSQPSPSGGSSPTWTSGSLPGSPRYQTGRRCPHHSCRETHQGRIRSIQPR